MNSRAWGSFVGLFLVTTVAAYAAQFGDFIYESSGTNVTITKYTGTGGHVTIPDTIVGLPVTRIGEGAFSGCISLANVAIGNSVTSIGYDAFHGCRFLTNVTIGNSVTSIGEWAFSGCTSLTAITVDAGNSRYSSVDGVLFDTRLTTLIQYPKGKAGSYTVPNSVTSIGEEAFYGCISLTSVTIPNSVTNIGEEAFYGCRSLTSATIGDGVTSIGGSAFLGCIRLTYITIPNSVTSLGDRVFSDCTRLTNVTIGSSVTNIGPAAFAGCTSLTNVTIGNSVTNIGYGAFEGCSLGDEVLFNRSGTMLFWFPHQKTGSYTIPDTVTAIGGSAFQGSAVAAVTIPDSVTNIGDGAFSDCIGLTSITIPNSVTRIGEGPFASCGSLPAITVDALNPSYSSVDGVLFDKTQMTLIQCPGGKSGRYLIPNSVINIAGAPFGTGAFSGCAKLTSITIPGSVRSIGDGAFQGCTSLTSIVIPDGVTSIGQRAFRECANLTAVYFQGHAPTLGDPYVLSDTTATVYYLPGTTGWGTTFEGRRTALWLPQVHTNDSSFGVRTNQFGFTIDWASDRIVVVEATTNMISPAWTPVGTNTLVDGMSLFTDPEWSKYPARFYRLRWP